MGSSDELQKLNNQFNSILSDYQNTYQEYIKIINSDNNDLMILKNFRYNGGNTMSKKNKVSNKNDCLESCQNTNLCTGANYDKNRDKCVLISGNGNLIKLKGKTAIVQKGTYYSYKLQELNNQLIQLNQQIASNISTSSSVYQENQEQQMSQQQAIQQNYHVLEGEREDINDMIREFQALEEANNDGEINVTMYYYNYIILAFIVFLLVVLLIKYSVTGQQKGGSVVGSRFFKEAIFLFGLMTIFLGLSGIFDNIKGFIFVAILLIAYLIVKMKLIHSSS
jgi:hypothetical protein